MGASEQFGATPAEVDKYGANLSIWEAVKLLQKYAPLVSYAREFVVTGDPYKKALIVADACEWVAAQTNATADDQLVKLLADVLKTKEGEALIRWCLLQSEARR